MLKTSGPALLGRLPRGFCLEHRVQDRQQFAHTGGQGDLGRFAGRPQPLVERFDHGITPAGGDRGHVQHRPDPGPPAEDHAPPPALARIAIERADPNQRADLPPVQGPQFGQRGQQGHRSHRADAGDAAQQSSCSRQIGLARTGPARHRRGSSDALRASQWSSGYPSASGMGAGQAFFSAVNISTNWRRRWSSAASAWVSSSFHGRGAADRVAKRASTRASKASVLARHPKAWRNPAPGGVDHRRRQVRLNQRGRHRRLQTPVASRTIRRGAGATSRSARPNRPHPAHPQPPGPARSRHPDGPWRHRSRPNMRRRAGAGRPRRPGFAGEGFLATGWGDSDPHPALGVERGLDGFGDRVLDL